MLKKLDAAKTALVVFLLAPALAMAQTAPDLSGMTSQIDWTTAIAAILVIAGGLAGVYVVVRAARFVLAVLRGG